MAVSMKSDLQNDKQKDDASSSEENRSHSVLNTTDINETNEEETKKKKKRELVEWNNDQLLLKKKNIKLFEENELNGIVNSLPYIDPFDKTHEEMAKQLIEEEMKLMKEKNEVKNYLENMDIPFTKYLNDSDSLIYKELKRCEEDKKFEKLNFDHYNLGKEEVDTEVLADKDMSIEEWKNRIKRYEIILENSHNALINIELMDKYKNVSWEEHLSMFSKIDINLQNNITSLKSEIEEINKKRKLHQLSFIDDITSLQKERKEYKAKSNLVLAEINRLLAENRLLEYKQNLV